MLKPSGPLLKLRFNYARLSKTQKLTIIAFVFLALVIAGDYLIPISTKSIGCSNTREKKRFSWYRGEKPLYDSIKDYGFDCSETVDTYVDGKGFSPRPDTNRQPEIIKLHIY
jgi:hypothetical protein